MAINFIKDKKIFIEIFSIIIIFVFQFANIKGENYDSIILKNYDLINNLTYGNNLRFCKECVCVNSQKKLNNKNDIILCLIKKNLYVLEQERIILQKFDLSKNLTKSSFNSIIVINEDDLIITNELQSIPEVRNNIKNNTNQYKNNDELVLFIYFIGTDNKMYFFFIK